MIILAGVATGLFVTAGAAAALGVRWPRSRRRPRPSTRATWLAQADAPVTAGQFRLSSIGLGAGVFLVVSAITAVPSIALAPAVVAGLAPRAWYARNRTRRQQELRASWPDGLRDLRASIAAGRSLHQALLDLAAHGPAPLRTAFARHPVRARTTGVVAALRTVQEELADPTSDCVIEVLVLAHERGGAVLPDVLDDLAVATGRDVEAAEELVTDSLEQRINAKAVFVLPWLVLLVLTAQAGVFRDFYRTGAGTAVILVGALMSLAGMLVVGRLARDPEEPRVFGAAAERP